MGLSHLRSGVAALLAPAAIAIAAAPASAADAQVVHVEQTKKGFVVSVDVPAGAQVDLAAVTATVQGKGYPTTAGRLTGSASEGSAASVDRSTVLAIDTSASMRGPRFAAAKAAARVFLDSVPDDVSVGVVSFDSDVENLLEPTTDRGAARSVLRELSLSRETLLYDGVRQAVDLAGSDGGQDSVLVLSDGSDTSSSSLVDLTSAIQESGVVVDVVALDQGGDLDTLDQIAGESGSVVNAGTDDLRRVFTEQAATLARQVGVTITVPASVRATQSTVAISLPIASGTLEASTTVPGSGEAPDEEATVIDVPREPTASSALPDLPSWAIYVGAGCLGLGLLGLLIVLVPGSVREPTVEERIVGYTATLSGRRSTQEKEAGEAALKQATDAVDHLLERNQSFQARVAQRLDAAGSELKPSEWLLVHVATVVVSAVLGLVVGGGNAVVALLFLVGGIAGPFVYLRLRAGRRRKRFESQLPDTMQLMSGSLSAGLSLMQSVDTVTREGPEPVASEFRRAIVETRIGLSLEDALDGIAERFDSDDFRWMVMAIRIQRQVGGNLAELLDTVAGTMREREYIRRQVAALAAEGKLSAIVLGGLPPGFLLYLLIGNRDYVMVLFTDPRGIAMIVGASLWLAVGVFWMTRLVKVEV